MANTFAVKNIRKVDRGSLVGYFDLYLPSGMVLVGCSLIDKDGSRFIGLPQREFLKWDGSKGYQRLVEIPDSEVREKFQRIVLPLAEKALR